MTHLYGMCVSNAVSFGQKGVYCTGHIQKAMARFVDDILVMNLRTAKIIVMNLVTNLKISDDF